MAQSPPPPSLRVRGPGKRRASSPVPTHHHPYPCPGPGFRAPSSSRIASGASHPRAHHVCAFGATAPAPGKVGRRPECEARRHAPYLGGDCPPVLLRAGLLEASPTWQGTVSKFPAASPWERHRGSSPAAANLGPAPVLLDRRGTQAGFFSYAKAQAPPQRPCSYQEPSANYHSKSTRLLLPCGRHSEALGPQHQKLWSCCSPAVPYVKLSSQARPPCNPPNPARKKVKARRDVQPRTKVAVLSPAQGPVPSSFFFPSKGKIYRLTTALPGRPKRVGFVFSSLPWTTVPVGLQFFFKVLATLLETLVLIQEAGASV